MFHRVVFYIIAQLIVLILLPTWEVFAQRCGGATAYFVRDERGKVMNLQEMEMLTIKVDGVLVNKQSLIVRKPWEFPPDQIEFKNVFPLVFAHAFSDDNKTIFADLGECGQIGEAIIIRGGKQMRLFFDIKKHNTTYAIDSLPFQEGAFHLRSLKCNDGAPPPLVDNNTVGACYVSADNWEGMDKDWVRHLLGGERWTAQAPTTDACRNNAIGVINTQSDWAAKWKLYKSYPRINPHIVRNGVHKPLPGIDFKRSVILTRHYLTDHYADRGYPLTIVVDKKGDLTIQPKPQSDIMASKQQPNVCTCLIVEIYRSDVKSVEGKPIPPAPDR